MEAGHDASAAPSKSNQAHGAQTTRGEYIVNAAPFGCAHVEHEEAAAPRPHQFAANGTRLSRGLVGARSMDPSAMLEASFRLLVQCSCSISPYLSISPARRMSWSVPELLDAMHSLHRRASLMILDDGLRLLFEHGRRRTLDAGVIDDEIRLEVVDHFVAQRQPLYFDRSVRVKRHGADATVGRDVLVLLADRLLEDVDLELASLSASCSAGTNSRLKACADR